MERNFPTYEIYAHKILLKDLNTYIISGTSNTREMCEILKKLVIHDISFQLIYALNTNSDQITVKSWKILFKFLALEAAHE